MDPESNRDGTFKPKNSMVMDGHCETALFKIRCLVLVDMALLVKALIICSNLSSNFDKEGGSNLAPPLRPQPWGAGAVSLNPPSLSFLFLLGTYSWLLIEHSFLASALCPSNNGRFGQGWRFYLFLPRVWKVNTFQEKVLV